jgi:hypothetical protein
MKAKEKANELGNKYYQFVADSNYPEYLAKQCALIAVDEILNNYYKNHFQTGKKIDYWLEVKQEIEKL